MLALSIEAPFYAAVALLAEGTKLELVDAISSSLLPIAQEIVDLPRLNMLLARNSMLKEVEKLGLNAWDPTRMTLRYAGEN